MYILRSIILQTVKDFRSSLRVCAYEEARQFLVNADCLYCARKRRQVARCTREGIARGERKGRGLWSVSARARERGTEARRQHATVRTRKNRTVQRVFVCVTRPCTIRIRREPTIEKRRRSRDSCYTASLLGYILRFSKYANYCGDTIVGVAFARASSRKKTRRKIGARAWLRSRALAHLSGLSLLKDYLFYLVLSLAYPRGSHSVYS